MRVLEKDDYKLLKGLLGTSQESLLKIVSRYISSRYKNNIITEKYVVGVGDIPIALVAHLDTVFKYPVQNLYYDKEKNVMWSPEGLGTDDRAGVFAILKLLERGYRPSVIFTTDEEKGGLGAAALGNSKCVIPGLKYLIELDRQGEDDCVFYDCHCPEFFDYVESFGFKHQIGSYSDISFLMGNWNVCGVNLSIGYVDEHSAAERLYVDHMLNTIDKVANMLAAENIPDFKYENFYDLYATGDFMGYKKCSCCGFPFSDFELFPVKGLDGKKKNYCPDCIVGNVDWCNVCQEAYEIADPKTSKQICNECAEEICTKTSTTSKNSSNQ